MEPRQSSTEATGRTVRAGPGDIFIVEFGEGPPLSMLHGGGPGASGAANFVRPSIFQ